MDLSLQAASAPVQRAVKRTLDLFLAIAGLLFCGPVFLLIGALIHLETPGGVFYRQERVGRGGQSFTLLKFRTMQATAEVELAQILATNAACRTEYEHYQKLAHDPRLTYFGRFLRKTSLDELPQLWNVLKGEMSLVGPRPFLPEQLNRYGPTYQYYRETLPGLTGLWQVSGRNRLSFEERVHLDEVYCREWSLWLDIQILLLTPKAVLSQGGSGKRDRS